MLYRGVLKREMKVYEWIPVFDTHKIPNVPVRVIYLERVAEFCVS